MKVKVDQLLRRPLSRRNALRLVGGVVAAAPVALLLGCEDETSPEPTSAAGRGGSGAAGSGGAGYAAGSGGSTSSAGAGQGGQASSASAWATGGTAALTALASYPNPFDSEDLTTCALFCQATLGPCHDDQAPEREDISEGEGGLPMRLGLRIVDDDCQPITDADVDIWHCDVRGIYSSETADNPDFCTGDDAEALAARYFRGHRMTDSNGIAWFNSCFPGWYNGRAIHIHFTVRRTSRTGSEYLTSQVGFSEDLISELCTTHPDYKAHGVPNTANTADNVFPSDSVDDYLLQTERMSDGALLAWKTIVIRSSLDESVCGASGSSGGMMPSGMGGPGMGG